VSILFQMHFLTLEIEATCSPETSIDFQWATRYYILDTELFNTTAVEPQVVQAVSLFGDN
jgi:hypothetical protein